MEKNIQKKKKSLDSPSPKLNKDFLNMCRERRES